MHYSSCPDPVTLLGVVRDNLRAVELVADEAIWQIKQVQRHPLSNTATLIIRLDHRHRLLTHLQ